MHTRGCYTKNPRRFCRRVRRKFVQGVGGRKRVFGDPCRLGPLFRGPARPSESALGSPLARRGCSPSFRRAKARIMRNRASDRAYRLELYVERRPGNLHKGLPSHKARTVAFQAPCWPRRHPASSFTSTPTPGPADGNVVV